MSGINEEASKLDQLNLNVLQDMSRTELQALYSLLSPRMTKYIVHSPTPKQAAFLLLENKEAFYGGAAGGGKSDALLMAGLQYVDVKGYAGIIFRKTYADLVKPGALIERAKEWLFRFNDVKWLEKDKKFEFFQKYGPHTETISTLQFGYLESDNDRFNYQGGEYQFIGFDELTHISEVNYLYLFSRLRRLRGSIVPLRVRGASNPPEDDYGQWVYHRFVNPASRRADTIFIPAGLDDNPFLDSEEYEKSLEVLDPVSRARLREGVWDIRRKGNMFKRDWFETIDVLPSFRRKIRFWDMASTAKKKKTRGSRTKDPDYTVGLLLSESGGIYYIEDIVRLQARPSVTEQAQLSTARSDGKNVIVREEQEPGSSGDAAIDMKARSIYKGYNYKGIRSTGDKVQRALAVSTAAERGHIKIARGCRHIEEFFGEAESFPGGLHDDMVDALSGAFNALGATPELYLPWMVENPTGSYWSDAQGDSDVIDFRDYYYR